MTDDNATALRSRSATPPNMTQVSDRLVCTANFSCCNTRPSMLCDKERGGDPNSRCDPSHIPPRSIHDIPCFGRVDPGPPTEKESDKWPKIST